VCRPRLLLALYVAVVDVLTSATELQGSLWTATQHSWKVSLPTLLCLVQWRRVCVVYQLGQVPGTGIPDDEAVAKADWRQSLQ
jgi:hypothetical protein